MRLWLDGMPAASILRGGTIADPSGFAYIGRRGGGEDTADCTGRLEAVYAHNTFCDNAAMLNLYQEVPAIANGTFSSHWRFYQPDAAEGTTIAGHGVDAPTIAVSRHTKVRLRWNIKRNGSTINEFFPLECRLNGGAFATIDNSCASNPACITTDSAKNMGDATANLLPTDGFTFAPGRFVVDTINAGLMTSIADGQVAEQEHALAFNQTLEDEDEIECRVRTASGDFGAGNYPAVLPKMVMNVGLAGAASRMEGGTSQGGTRR